MTSTEATPNRQRRNKGFEETHLQMIETAIRLISEKGVESLTIAELARTMGIYRTTVYYHFDSRDALLEEVTLWSSKQLAKAFSLQAPLVERIDYITHFVLDNPELIKLWIEDLISEGDIRHSYPLWDKLVKGIKNQLNEEGANQTVDAEVFCINLLVSAIIGPRVFKNSISPEEDTETVVRRFRGEHQRFLLQQALDKE